MSARTICLTAYLLMLAPIVVFFFGWLQIPLAFVMTVLIGGGFVWLFRSDFLKDRTKLDIPYKHFILIAACFGLLVLMSGNCGFSKAAFDTPWRMSALGDLIAYDWPVKYESGYALVYYLPFWLIPALAGKVFGMTGALVVMWAYETAILVVSFLLISLVLKAKKVSTFWIIAVVMALFSGLNYLGVAVVNVLGLDPRPFLRDSAEGWLDFALSEYPTVYLYRSNLDLLLEIYNQMVIWLAVPLLLYDRRIRSFIFLGMCVLPFSPWGLLGLIPLMVCMGCRDAFGKERRLHSAGEIVKEVLSPANVAALLSVGFIFIAYFACSMNLSTSSEAVEGVANASASKGTFGMIPLWELGPIYVFLYLLFLIVEFGIFAVFLFSSKKRDPLFWTAVGSLMIIPLFWIGGNATRDLCMNASLPALYLFTIWVAEYLIHMSKRKGHLSAKDIAFLVACGVASLSFMLCMFGQVRAMVKAQEFYVPSADYTFTTFETTPLELSGNFVCTEPEKTFFFTYLAR